MTDALSLFTRAVRIWFEETFGEPTPPQAQGWPAIQRGEHTLILAPTGSGKTLTAFLWAIDEIYRETSDVGAGFPRPSPPSTTPGIRLVYISPLKALNNDIERNLRAPLAGIRAVAARLGQALPPLRRSPIVAVRTGDTPASARAAMLKQPPHILITTPESFYLMLTSPRARELFRPVRTVVVDEIHTLCGDKRGVHLSLSLERLERLAGRQVQRVGLSATVRPLEEAARFLGGQTGRISESANGESANGESRTTNRAPGYTDALIPRPVTIIDAGYRKPLDIQVVTPVEDFHHLPGDTIWPTLIPQVLGDVMRHRSTLIFCNNRRLAERTADRLNAQIAAERSEEVPPGSTEALAPGGVALDRGIFAIGAEGPIRAHHGSMAKEARRQMEEDLKAGKLPALVGTSSLELGIDIGAVDLVVQVQSPKSVAQGLQRIGRSGHLVGQTSRGRIYATYREEIDEAAALARGMLDGDVEPTTTPRNPLDVLAQQIVAMVAVEPWPVMELYGLVRQAYAYRDLPLDAFTAVLDMLAGKYAGAGGQGRAALRPRLAWDRVNNRLAALPGTRLLALSNAGTISDTGAYDVYLADGKTKVGQLDEEFVFETRAGDTFLLGSNTWRVLEIADDRILVGEAAGALPRMPFWRGDYPWRPYELGVRIGRLRRELADRIRAAGSIEGQPEQDNIIAWLRCEYALDENSARNLIDHVSRQLDAVGEIASDTTVLVESFQDALGESRMVIHSPFGGRVNGAWALALSSALRDRVGIEVETQANDDGILLRYPVTGREPPVDIVAEMTAAAARERILRELPDSALFGAHFRMNAGRALLLPKARGRKRTPFWLQRLRARDLLATVRQLDDFPIIAETYRDCLRDVLDLPHLEQILNGIASGAIRVIPVESAVPSPVAMGLLYAFISVYMYEWDAPKAERQLQSLATRGGLLDTLWAEGADSARPALKPEAAAEVTAHAQKTASNALARSTEELAVYLAELGDLTGEEIAARCAGDAAAWLAELAGQGRIVQVLIPTARGSEHRWTPVELAAEYRSLAALAGSTEDAEVTAAATRILRRHLRNSGPLTQEAILHRYAFDPAWLAEALGRLVAAGDVVQGYFTSSQETTDQSTNLPLLQYCDRHNLEQIFRRTLTLLRREVQPVSLAAYADFLTRWQGIRSTERSAGAGDLRRVMAQLAGIALPGLAWERDVLPARLHDDAAGDLGDLCAGGDLVWAGSGRDPRRGRVCFFGRGEGRLFLDPTPPDLVAAGLSEPARAVYGFLKSEGASFLADMQAGLGWTEKALQDALAELTMAGLVTNDTLEALNAVMAHGIGAPAAAKAFGSTLEDDLAALRGEEPRRLLPGRIDSRRLQAAARRVSARLKTELEAPAWPGRWSLLHRAAVLGPGLDEMGRGERLARILLARYGVVQREAVEREAGAWDWALVSPPLQRMELAGQVRRGYFVAGLSGIQYALPEVVDALRAAAAQPDETLVVLNAVDPAHPYGGETGRMGETAPMFARVPSTHIVLRQGQVVLLAEDNGARLTPGAGCAPDVVRRGVSAYLGAYQARPNAPQRLLVKEWGDAPVLGSEAEPILRALSFSRVPNGLEWWMGR